MTRTTNTPSTKHRRKKIIKSARGYFGVKHKLFKAAKEQNMRSSVYSYSGRKQRKRMARRLGITRLNKGSREHGITYSQLVHLLKMSQIILNRKQLSEMLVNRPDHFSTLIQNLQNSSN